jgi:beta-alanine degradation protein BauB
MCEQEDIAGIHGATDMRFSRSIITTSVLSFALGAGAVWAQQQGASRREPQFENDQMKVWKSIIMPNQPLTLHRHDHGRALIALTDGVLNLVDKDSKPIETYHWEKGRAYWLDANKPGEMHAEVNRTSKPIEVIVVELKKDR